MLGGSAGAQGGDVCLPGLQTHQMDQQRSEAEAKDSALVKEHVERLRADQEKDTLTTELVSMRAGLVAAESAQTSQKAECRRLQDMLTAADEVCALQQSGTITILPTCPVLGRSKGRARGLLHAS